MEPYPGLCMGRSGGKEKRRKKKEAHQDRGRECGNGMSSPISIIRFKTCSVCGGYCAAPFCPVQATSRALSLPCRAHKYTSEYPVSLTIDRPSALPFRRSTPASSLENCARSGRKTQGPSGNCRMYPFSWLDLLLAVRANQP